MKNIAINVAIAAACAGSYLPAEAAESFVARTGETVVINSASKLPLFFNSFTLQDNSTLVVEGRDLSVSVGELTIGNKVRIIGNGKDGADGQDAPSNKPTTGQGDGGWPGDNGGHGTSGQNAANISFVAGVLRPIGENFVVQLRGGKGGDGGDGGQGGHGGPAECHQRAGDGGPGGRAGNAGSGGNGGKFSLRFSNYLGKAAPIVLGPDNFDVDGGDKGARGKPGGGGHGGDGVNCFPFGATGGGGVGGSGDQGAPGVPGKRQPPVIQAI